VPAWAAVEAAVSAVVALAAGAEASVAEVHPVAGKNTASITKTALKPFISDTPMTLLTKQEQEQVAAAISAVEQETDAEIVTVLTAQADNYAYIPLLWAGLIALVVPGIVNYFAGWLTADTLLLGQWGATGMLIFVSEAERYVEILVDEGISSKIDNSAWDAIIADFTEQVKKGKTLHGFITCIEACGIHLKTQLPATHQKNELPNHLVILS